VSKTKNNHFVSRFLLEPWEIRKGKLLVFNYATKTFSEADTEKLFAKEGLFSQEQENFFNKHIETITRQELSSLEKNGFKINKWKNYRAIVLLLWDLIGRFQAAKNNAPTAVDFFTNLDQDKMNALVSAIESMFETVVINISASDHLCFPSNLLIYVFDSTTGECSFGIPIDTKRALFAVRHGTDLNEFQKLSKTRYLQNVSIGNYATDFIVVPPGTAQTDEMAVQLCQQREINEKAAKNIAFARAFIIDALKQIEAKNPNKK